LLEVFADDKRVRSCNRERIVVAIWLGACPRPLSCRGVEQAAAAICVVGVAAGRASDVIQVGRVGGGAVVSHQSLADDNRVGECSCEGIGVDIGVGAVVRLRTCRGDEQADAVIGVVGVAGGLIPAAIEVGRVGGGGAVRH